jgi:PhnB protein
MSVLNPYLNFRSDARAALEFYEDVFGGEATISSFRDFGMEDVPDAERDLVMHGQLTTAAGFTIMASDVPSHMDYVAGTNDFSVSLSGDADDEAQLRGYWLKLSEGAEIQEALSTAPWGDTFGMLKDKFGINWLVNISGAAAA